MEPIVSRCIAIFIIVLMSLDQLGAKELEKVSLQLHWKYQFEFAGFIAAKEKGFYRDAGLDVELKEYRFGQNVVDEILNDKSTYGIYNSNLLELYMIGKPIKLMASFFKRSAIVIITKPDIKTIKDLRGKTIMAAGKKDFDSNFKYIFDEENIDIDSLKFIPHTYDIQSFINGKCDAMTAFISDQPYQLDKLGVKYNIIDPTEYGIYNLQLELFTTQDEIKYHNARARVFKEASIKGWKYALSHREELIKVIKTKYNPSLSYDFLSNEAKKTELLLLPKVYNIGSIDKQFLRKQFELNKEYLGLGNIKSIYSYVYDTDISKVSIHLSSKNQEYLRQKGEIRVCYDKTFSPITYSENDYFRGMSHDVLKLISQKLNISFKYIETYDWMEQMQYLKNNRCDITAVAMTKPNYYEFLIPTDSYMEDRLVLITKINEPYFSKLEDIKDKTIGIKYGFSVLHKYLSDKYPNLNFVELKNGDCKSVLEDKVFGYVTVSLQASSKIAKYYSNQLKIMTGALPKEIYGGFGVSSRDKPLVGILNEGIEEIKQSQLQNIYKKYYNIKVENEVDLKIIFYLVIFFALVVGVIILFLVREKRFNSILENKIKEAIEQSNIQNQQLIQQSRLAQMGEMISMIAHQWRQPLSAITARTGSMTLKLMMNKQISSEMLRSELDSINKSAQYLSNTINDFRDFFKDDKSLKSTSIESIVRSTLDIIQVSIENKNIAIVTKYGCNKKFNVLDNEAKQVILNILKNAEDALLEKNIENPTITIESSCNIDHNKPILYIKDNAGGIAEDIIDKIFDPYFSTKKEKNGTGLGLYMSKIIIQDHCDGVLSVYNDDDGAVFKIEF